MLGISLPSYTQTSVPSARLTLLGAMSFHLSGKWFSNMSGGSTTWSSTLTRIRSSSCIWPPHLLTLASGYSPPRGGQTSADLGRPGRLVRPARRALRPVGGGAREARRASRCAGGGRAAQRHRVLRDVDGGGQGRCAVPSRQLASQGGRDRLHRRRCGRVGGRGRTAVARR